MSMSPAEFPPSVPRVLLAPDSFKGSLDALRAAQCMARGVARALPGCVITQVPMADGGEGSAAVVASALAGVWASLHLSINGIACGLRNSGCGPLFVDAFANRLTKTMR